MASSSISHGCFCEYLLTGMKSTQHFRPIDEHDSVCKANALCGKCIDCHDKYPYSVNPDLTCDSGSNTECQQNQCLCDLHTAQSLVDTFPVTIGGCTSTNQAIAPLVGSNVVHDWRCCGDVPNFSQYNPTLNPTHDCINGQVVDYYWYSFKK